MSVHVPGPRLGSSIPFKHLGGKGGHGRKGVYAGLNLTAMVDMMTMLVVFLLSTFSASGEILMSQKGLDLPQGINDKALERAPIVSITRDAISFTRSGEESATVADPRTISEDQSLEWKIVELYDRLQIASWDFEKQDMPEEQRRQLRGLLVLQADKTVEAKVLNRVMKTAYAANYPNIMFAINKKARD
jgi:biopolymer transport protein ExbD